MRTIGPLVCITSRVYPTLSDALGLELWSSGGNAIVKSMKVWEMGSAYGKSVPGYWPEPNGDDASDPDYIKNEMVQSYP
ncbi:GH32 C-terminal domain-containing protein [Neobacillus sp. NPDC093182]|uniref:GH32 C-terminal domain-containing protein n=1 Tax=Neobacillus sp. NPDC093182 TaxID=3364297 RepID=UPI0037F5C107